jgi:hypothetical protein
MGKMTDLELEGRCSIQLSYGRTEIDSPSLAEDAGATQI